MATIATSIRLTDGMTPALRSMTNALNIALSSFEAMQAASSHAIDTESISRARTELARAESAFDGIEQEIQQAKTKQDSFNKSVKGGSSAASDLWNKIKGIAATLGAGMAVKQAVQLSDEFVNTRARLDMMNDGLQSTDELQQMIYESAQRSRGSYQSSADAIGKMGIMAKDAFKSNAELVAFTEQLNKQFAIAGTSQEGISAAMLQLTQAMGSGVLRGEELNSVFEQAPTIIQTIADYLNVPIGQIRDMAQEGQLTAETVKNALLSTADQTNAKFESMPKTFGQMWQGFKNTALMAFQPVLLKMNELGNSAGFQKFVSFAAAALPQIASVAITVFDYLLQIGGKIAEALTPLLQYKQTAIDAFNAMLSAGKFVVANWDSIGAAVSTVIGPIMAYKAGVMALNTYNAISNAIEAVSNGLKVAGAIASYAKAAATGTEVSATTAATVAQAGFNTTLLACPIFWIIAALIALCAVIYLVVKHWDTIKAAVISFAQTAMTYLSAFWAWLCGIFGQMGTILVNMWNGVVQSFSNAWQQIYTAVSSFVQQIWAAITGFCMAVWNTIVTIFTTILNFWIGIWQAIWGVIGGAVTAIASVVYTVFYYIFAIIGAVMQGIWNLIVMGWNIIYSAVSSVLMQIWAVIVSVWTTITSHISAALQAIWAVVVSVWTVIYSTISSILSSIWAVISSVWSSIMATVSSVLSSIWNTVVTIWNNIYTSISTVMTSIWNVISTAWNNVYNTVSEVLGNIWTAIVDKWNEILDWLGQLPGKMLELGRSIIEGLLNGITEKMKALRSKIEEVGEVVLGGVKDFFKIGSPSKEFALVGRYNIEGLTNGMDEFMPKLDFAVGDIGKVFSDALFKKDLLKLPMLQLDYAVGTVDRDASSQMLSDDYNSPTLADRDLHYMRYSGTGTTSNSPVIVNVQLDVNNQNSIASETDIDTVVQSITDKLYDAVSTSMEGVTA